MRKLNVFLKESLSPIFVGTLVETDNKRFYFEYDDSFIEKKFNLSPFKLRFSRGLQDNKDNYPRDTFGVFDDSLPDGWGLLVMDRFFRRHDRDIRDISIIDRLAYIGDHGMGALTYKPAENLNSGTDDFLDLHSLAENSLAILQGKEDEILPAMAQAGGSPGGARPKILVGVNGKDLIHGEGELPLIYEPWLIKFRSENDFIDAGKIEYVYAQMAKGAGINIAEYRLFMDTKGNSYFGTKRFDRINHCGRVHTHTLSNLIHADFRLPSLDYEALLKVCSKLTGNYSDLRMCFRLMVFNVLSHNRDDHGKNFAFLADSNGQWSFAPAYDLMFSYGPNGEHTTTVAGEGRSPSMKDFAKLAFLAGISEAESNEIINEVRESLNNWKKLATEENVLQDEIVLIGKYISKQLMVVC